MPRKNLANMLKWLKQAAAEESAAAEENSEEDSDGTEE